MFKKVYSLYSAFYPSLRFTLSLQSAFYTQSAFYPWSAVCSPQSAFYTDRLFFFHVRTDHYGRGSFLEGYKEYCGAGWSMVQKPHESF